jgi:hypothetical protein
MYIDEVGNHDLTSCHDDRYRYLNLTGVIMGVDYVRETVQPEINALKERFFGDHHDPDDPVILHRKELVNAKTPFASLCDPAVKGAFDAEFLRLVTELEYVVISVLIDKKKHLEFYSEWANDPYHYAMEVLMERFVLWLAGKGPAARGDIIAESRGGKEDMRLKEVFRRLYDRGSDNISHATFAERLTSGKLKVKPKTANTVGLQFADLLAHPLYKSMIAEYEGINPPANYGRAIYDILAARKIRRSPGGKVAGWGLKWLP